MANFSRKNALQIIQLLSDDLETQRNDFEGKLQSIKSSLDYLSDAEIKINDIASGSEDVVEVEDDDFDLNLILGKLESISNSKTVSKEISSKVENLMVNLGV